MALRMSFPYCEHLMVFDNKGGYTWECNRPLSVVLTGKCATCPMTLYGDMTVVE